MRSNDRVAAAFHDIADFLGREHGNPFRIRAYRTAAAAVAAWPEDLERMLADGDPLTVIPGVGEDLARRAEAIVRTGATRFRDARGLPVSSRVLSLFRLPGLGRRRVQRLQQAGITNLSQLREAALQGRLRGLQGFSARTEERLLREIDALERRRPDQERRRGERVGAKG